MAVRKYQARIRVKEVMPTTTTVEMFANTSSDAKKVIIAQYCGGDRPKVQFSNVPKEVK